MIWISSSSWTNITYLLVWTSILQHPFLPMWSLWLWNQKKSIDELTLTSQNNLRINLWQDILPSKHYERWTSVDPKRKYTPTHLQNNQELGHPSPSLFYKMSFLFHSLLSFSLDMNKPWYFKKSIIIIRLFQNLIFCKRVITLGSHLLQ